MRLLLALLFSVLVSAADIPAWLPAGLLQVETGSTYKVSGLINYVDRSGDDDLDIGPFQMTEEAFRRVSRPGEDWRRLKTDTRYADAKARAYMVSLYENEARGDWAKVAAMWNVGPNGLRRTPAKGRRYAERVENIGMRFAHGHGG